LYTKSKEKEVDALAIGGDINHKVKIVVASKFPEDGWIRLNTDG
jgi:hypothetical protein